VRRAFDLAVAEFPQLGLAQSGGMNGPMLVIAYVYFRRLDRSAKRGAERPSLNE